MRTILRFSFLMLITFCGTSPLIAQQSFEKSLPFFNKVYVSDRIDLLLEESSTARAWVSYENVAAEDIRLEVKSSTLRVYLEGCRRGCRDNKYPDARVQLHLNYKQLEKLVVMGDQRVEHLGDIRQDAFVLKSYGDGEILLDSIHTYRLKLALFGDSKLYVRDGIVNDVVVKTFGDQQVDLANLASQSSQVRVFGDSELDLRVHEALRLSVFGDADIRFSGNPSINRKLVLGEVSINHLDSHQESSAWGAFFRW